MTNVLLGSLFFAAGLLTLFWDLVAVAVTEAATSLLVTVLVTLVLAGILAAAVLELLEVDARLYPPHPTNRTK